MKLIGLKPSKKKPEPTKSSIDVVTIDGKIAIRFPEAIKNAVFTAKQAKDLAVILVKLGLKIEQDNAIK